MDPAFIQRFCLCREILGAMRLAGVFNHDQAILFGQIENSVHVGHLPVEMNGNHRRHRPLAAPADGPARSVATALLFQILPQLRDRHVIGLLVDIDELRQRARLGDGFGGGDKRMRHGQHHVARLHAGRHQGKAQRIRTAVHGHRSGGSRKMRRRPSQIPPPWARR